MSKGDNKQGQGNNEVPISDLTRKLKLEDFKKGAVSGQELRYMLSNIMRNQTLIEMKVVSLARMIQQMQGGKSKGVIRPPQGIIK